MEGLPYALSFASVWSLEYAGTILSEIPRLSPPPTFPVSRILSLRDETHCSVMWWDLTVILRLIVHCARSRRLEPVPALTPAGADAQAARATRGYSRSATVLLSASAPNDSKADRRGHSKLTQRPLRSDDDDVAHGPRKKWWDFGCKPDLDFSTEFSVRIRPTRARACRLACPKKQ